MDKLKDNLNEALKNNANTPSPELPRQGLDVFISYSSLNKNVADAVVSDFENNGIRCWYAPRDIMPGQEWVTSIHDAINACKLFVLIYTDSSNESKQVANEVALAFNSGKTLIPFKLSDTQMSSELEYYLTRVHWLDAVNPPLLQSIENLRKYSKKILEGNIPKESKIRNSTSPIKKTVPTYWLYPVIVALVALLVIAIILLFKDKNNDTGTDNGTQLVDSKDNTDQNTNLNDKNGQDVSVPTNDPVITEPDILTPEPDNDVLDEAKIIELYDKAYDIQTHNDAADHLELAYDYYMQTGDAVTDKPAIAEAIFMLGLKYIDGDEVEQSYEKGTALLNKAADSNYLSAYNYLGNMYLNGDGVEQDYEQALMYYTKSASNDNAIGVYNLACMYEYGYGVEIDLDKAKELYQKGADLGHRDSMTAYKRLTGQ